MRAVLEAARLPRVSVVVPCRNEERFIERALDSLLGGSYPRDLVEVIVVDGGSTDRTRKIVADRARSDGRVRLIDNRYAITPVGLNLGIASSHGQVIARADAHTIYPPEYLAALVRALIESGADMVGGLAENVPCEEGPLAEALSIATGSAFGTGSPFRYRKKSGPVDTVPFGCWWREGLLRFGLFDERLVRNQDNELASRILRDGGRIFQTDATCVRYFNRPSLRGLWRQAATTGMWNAFTQRLHPYTFRLRHFLPGLFFLGVLAAAAAILVGGLASIAGLAGLGAAVLAPYFAVNGAVATVLAQRRRRLALAPLIAFVLASYHFTYGFGIAKGWLLVATGAWRRRLGGRKEARLS